MTDEVKTTFLDKAISAVSPARGVARMKAKHQLQVMAGYSGAVDTRFRNNPWMNTAKDGSEERVLSYGERVKMLRNVSEMRRNLGLMFGLLNRFANGVVGTGLVPIPQTDDDEYNKESSEYWQDYMLMCDHRQRLNGRQMQLLTVKDRLTQGESGFIKITNGRLQPTEAERIATPMTMNALENKSIVQGIKKTPDGIPLGYYICNRKQGGIVDRNDYKFIRKRDFIHPNVVERFDQMRGTAGLASIVDKLRDKGELEQATLFKAKLAAFKAWGIYTDEDVQSGNSSDRTDTDPTLSDNIRVEKHQMGEQWYLPANSKLEDLESKTPNNMYESYSKGIGREIAMAVDIPYEVLMLDLLKASFSGGNGIMMLANQTYDIWQQWLVEDLLQPWWNWRIGMAIVQGHIKPAPVNKRGVSQWTKVEWNPAPRGWWDQQGKAKANKIELMNGSTSIQRVARSKGSTRNAIFKERREDIELAIEEAEAINKKHPGANVQWTQICNFGTPLEADEIINDPADEHNKARKKEEEGTEE